MLILTESDVRDLLTMPACIAVMREALAALSRGDASMPLRTVVRLPNGRDAFALMPAYSAGEAALGVKAITVYPGNHGTALDSHQGAILLFDANDGRLQAVIDATSVTAIRTAAVSALATRLLARKDASSLAILGAGVQGRMHLDAIPLVRPIDRVCIWSRDPERAHRLAEHARALGIADVETPPTAEAAARSGHIVCVTTSATEPVLHGAWLAPGTHVNAVGACTPNAREIDTAVVARSRLFVDRRDSALREPGDILVPLEEGSIGPDHILGELGDLVLETVVGRESASDITLFKSLGLAIEDLAAARYLHDRAVASGRGQRIALGGGRDQDA